MPSKTKGSAPDPALIAEARQAIATGEFKRLRLAARLTQGEMAAWLGVTWAAVGAWERGERFPQARYAVPICDLLRRLQAVLGVPA
jgi:DNA-binding transcriptional regulator YiaG